MTIQLASIDTTLSSCGYLRKSELLVKKVCGKVSKLACSMFAFLRNRVSNIVAGLRNDNYSHRKIFGVLAGSMLALSTIGLTTSLVALTFAGSILPVVAGCFAFLAVTTPVGAYVAYHQGLS